MVEKYNNTYLRSIKLTPTDARYPANYEHVHDALYAKVNVRQTTLPKFHLDDNVCIVRKKGTFEVFTIATGNFPTIESGKNNVHIL